MILPLTGSNQLVDITASNIHVSIKRRKPTPLSSDALLKQDSKLEIWGRIESLHIGGNSCDDSCGNDYVCKETAPLFFEQSDYIISAKSLLQVPLFFDHADKGIREAVSATDEDEPDRISGVINFGSEVGYSNLHFYDGQGNRLLLEIEVFPAKLSYKDDYEAIRNDINEMVEAAAIDFINSTYSLGIVSHTRNNVPAIFFSLLNQLFEKYFKAAKVIMQNPNHKLVTEHIKLSAHKLKQADNKTAQWIAKHPEQVKRRDGKTRVNCALGVRKNIRYNTVENQLVKFMLNTTVKKLIVNCNSKLNKI